MTWEERMAARAHERAAAQRRAELARAIEEGDIDPRDRRAYAGRCDVCGGDIVGETYGLPDIYFREDGGAYTYARHGGGPRRECHIYASAVDFVERA